MSFFGVDAPRALVLRIRDGEDAESALLTARKR
jgi:hypothetical protein